MNTFCSSREFPLPPVGCQVLNQQRGTEADGLVTRALHQPYQVTHDRSVCLQQPWPNPAFFVVYFKKNAINPVINQIGNYRFDHVHPGQSLMGTLD